MSGGSWGYFYSGLNDVGQRLRGKDQSPLRRAFGTHLVLCATALHHIEWVDSGDYGEDADVEAIKACLSGTAPELQVLISDAKELIAALQEAISESGGEDA